MHLFGRKTSLAVVLMLYAIISAHCQTVSTTKNGLWTDPTLWDGGNVPSLDNATEIIVDHDVEISAASNINMRNVIVRGRLTIFGGATVTVVSDALVEKRDLQVFGTLVLHDGAVLNGTSVANVSFESGARYVHLQGPLGFIPYAAWDINSTFEIAGFKSQGYINIAHSDSWKQNFGHVLYNCSEQTTAFVDLNGYLRNIAGNFTVQSTNNQALRLSTTQNAVISIGGNFTVDGPSKIWMSTAAANTIITVQQDFRYRSTSAGISYLTTRGAVTMNINGHMEINSPGRIHMATTAADSTGARQSTITLQKDLNIATGTLIAPPSPGRGTISFSGTGLQVVNTSPTGDSFQGNLNFVIDGGAVVDVRNSALSNTTGTLVVKGKLCVGSADPGGAIQLGNKGNIRVQGSRIFESGSSIEYNGVAEQRIGNGHPLSTNVNLICNNPFGIVALNAVTANHINLLGRFNSGAFPITATGNISIAPGVEFNNDLINLTGSQEQQISGAGATIRKMIINKSGSGVTLTTPLKIEEKIAIESTNTILHSNGNLILLSGSDASSGTASVGPLPAGSSIQGDVTVNRHMAGEGRIYRYISSPVQNATIASLKDDFPVTGKFLDPSTGPGIVTSNPSVFYYNESMGGLQAGWIPYPTSGLASDNPLMVGKGYAAFIRNGNSSTMWDVTGTLNQGTIEIPLDFSSNNDPSNGWNLVGNPYASAIRWGGSAENEWTMESISSVIAIRDNGSAGGTFRYWDMDENYSEISNGQIAACQSFWVRAIGVNPKLTIREGAKAANGAEFFRKITSVIPSFAIEISREKQVDVAYYKIRPSATQGIDHWDGLKLDNDNFDLSFVDADQNSFAIYATHSFPCDTTVQLGLKDVTPGTYNIKIITKHNFARYDFVLIDKFLKKETLLHEGEDFDLIVTSDPASYTFDRISLHLTERPPDTDIDIQGPHTACSGDVVKLTAQNIENNILYSWWDQGTILYASGENEEMALLSVDTLAAGDHVLQLKAHSACHIKLVQENHLLTVKTTPKIWADSSVICLGASATLKAYSDQSPVEFAWFPDESFLDTLMRGPVFESPPLVKSTRYQVVGSASSGCLSTPIEVKATVKIYNKAEVSVIDENRIASNYSMGNTWYLNDQKLDEAGQVLRLSQPGIYTLQVDTLGCTSEATFEYNVLPIESSVTAFSFYPNPVEETLWVTHPFDEIISIELVNSLGATVIKKSNNGLACSLDVRGLPDGNYTSLITTLKDRKVFRVIKANEQ